MPMPSRLRVDAVVRPTTVHGGGGWPTSCTRPLTLAETGDARAVEQGERRPRRPGEQQQQRPHRTTHRGPRPDRRGDVGGLQPQPPGPLRFAQNGQPIRHTRSTPSRAAPGGIGWSTPSGTATSCTWTNTSKSRLSSVVIAGLRRLSAVSRRSVTSWAGRRVACARAMSRLTASKSPRARIPARRIAPRPGERGVSATCATTSRTRHSLHSDGRSQSSSGLPSMS